MNATEELQFIRRVLDVYDKADCHEQLYWRVEPEKVVLLALCNDLFWWGTADAEEITLENVAILEQTFTDLNKIEYDINQVIATKGHLPITYFSELFAARSRKMRPQQPCYETMSPEIATLFNACGPERDPKTEG